MSNDTINVLLVEDNEDHIFLTRRALLSSGMPLSIHVVQDGDAAVDFVHQNGAHAGAPRPDLILLDIKLPGRDGFEVLEEIKNDNRFKSIPVVLLTSSAAEADVLRGYGLGTNSYVTKPVKIEEMMTKLQQIPGYWTQLNVLPPRRQ